MQTPQFTTAELKFCLVLLHASSACVKMPQYVCIRLGRKGANFGNSLTAAGVCCLGSRDEDVVKYFGKHIVFTSAQLDLKFMY